VTLKGRVPSREMRRRAEDVVFDVTGVRQVNNDLRITGAASDRD
jgi:osmotically-inducible protein OsmY